MNTNPNSSPLWFVGTCGISDPGWLGNFYPKGLRQPDWFPYYATRFNSIEFNVSFHRIPMPQWVRRWDRVTPPDFRFCFKFLESITHNSPDSLSDPGSFEKAKEFFDVVGELGPKLAGALMQFHPEFSIHYRDLLFRFLDRISCPTRLIVEFRHDSWWTNEVAKTLRDRGVGWAAADMGGHPEVAEVPLDGRLRWFGLRPIISTADFLYIRGLGDYGQFPIHTKEHFNSTPRLAWWHQRLTRILEARPGIRHVYAFFDNDFSGNATMAARRFARMVKLPDFYEAPFTQRQPSLFS